MHRAGSKLALGFAAVIAAATATRAAGPQRPSSPPVQAESSSQRQLLNRYCIGCHNERMKVAGLVLDSVDLSQVGGQSQVWEKVVRKLRGGLMPPAGRPR